MLDDNGDVSVMLGQSMSHMLDPQPLDILAEPLPEIHPRFFVPRLTDKPQNPIMDTINLLQSSHTTCMRTQKPQINIQLLPESTFYASDLTQEDEDDLWERAAMNDTPYANQIMSWDALRHSFNPAILPSAFLSEQTSQVFASVRYHIRPCLPDPSAHLVYVTPIELFDSLRLSVSGVASALYSWDHSSERFVLRNIPHGTNGSVILLGTDEVVSSSVTRRFLTIGTLIRRLEVVVSEYRSQSEPVANAFAHAISCILHYIRQLTASLPTPHVPETGLMMEDATMLIATWTHYANVEEMTDAVAALCGREESVSPSGYSMHFTSASELLSRIYATFDEQIERQAPRLVIATLAYILTVTSRDYFEQVERSVGYRPLDMSDTSFEQLPLPLSNQITLGIGDDERVENSQEDMHDLEPAPEKHPVFMQDIADIIPRARKSLGLLRRAQPHHPLLDRPSNQPSIRWIWTQDEVTAAWTGQVDSRPIYHDASVAAVSSDQSVISQRTYKDELKTFAIFDLAPGANLSSSASRSSSTGMPLPHKLVVFLESFVSLPSLTPTLSHLASLVLSPLATHMGALSSALVALFLSPETRLNFRLHLVLLRSYLLLASYSFHSRVSAALFSDADNAISFRRNTRSRSRHRAEGQSAKSLKRQPIGLSPSLIEEEIWPPRGADLSFHLRTVIIDSLGSVLDREDYRLHAQDARDQVLQEAEWRLGFALRDLPSTGKEKWLDPSSIEALDFLYMDYKPPKPLDALLTPDVLSKYHRLFTFNLRLMRVSAVMAAFHRMVRRSTQPLFPTLSRSNKLLLHFRFIAHAFITALSSYVYDTAIGANFDAFLAELHTDLHPSSPRSRSVPHRFPDIFTLAERHSSVLDNILSACLLRSGQRAAGDVLRGCLETVFEFARLAADRQRGVLEEYEAVPTLEDLWAQFRHKMTTLIGVLKTLVERDPTRAQVPEADWQFTDPSRVKGLAGNLHDLLVRLDFSEYWLRKYSSNHRSAQS